MATPIPGFAFSITYFEWGGSFASAPVGADRDSARLSPRRRRMSAPHRIVRVSSHTNNKREAYASLLLLVRVARLELAASWSQTASEDFYASKMAVFLWLLTKTELFDNDNSVNFDHYFSGSGQICGQTEVVFHYCGSFLP